ncbi:ankyrin repeat family protein [Novosphingobium sp. Rr 2-17]|uniref:ankyrin repeat domain-containing protein n=1 Tax=Novosphingobium sp. Rr 2-17 TaxID=555793 RepID=UPI000269A4A1|nr:ankyrin repeat domain-containing protein [Novosphingobium sp. Rr 2-17]EIZ80900.1 ankyrin repeat family protein [Novosphingobium sp. Rr 2-17]
MHSANDNQDQAPSGSAKLPPLPSPERVQELLFDAARLGRDDMVPILLEAGADIEATDAKGHTALVLASYNGFETTSALLLEHGANPNGTTTSGSPLMGVAFKGHLAIAQRLLAAGADPNLRNRAGQTAIMMSALFDRRAIIELLLDAGADLNAADAAGNNAADLARVQGNADLAQWLMGRRAPDPDAL